MSKMNEALLEKQHQNRNEFEQMVNTGLIKEPELPNIEIRNWKFHLLHHERCELECEFCLKLHQNCKWCHGTGRCWENDGDREEGNMRNCTNIEEVEYD